jgi:hypothetical protein
MSDLPVPTFSDITSFWRSIPATEENRVRFSKLSDEQKSALGDASSETEAEKLFGGFNKSHPAVLLAAAADIRPSESERIIRLRDYHWLARMVVGTRLTFRQAIERSSTALRSFALVTEARAIVTDSSQLDVPYLTPEALNAQVEEIRAEGYEDREITQSFLRTAVDNVFCIPQVVAWSSLDGVSSFKWHAKSCTFTFEGVRYRVDQFGRVFDEDFPKFMKAMEALPGKVIPIPFTDADCYAVGYLTGANTFVMSGDKVVLTPAVKKVVTGPLAVSYLRKTVAAIQTGVAKAMAELRVLQQAKPGQNWHRYCAYAYAFAKHHGYFEVDLSQDLKRGIAAAERRLVEVESLMETHNVVSQQPMASRRAMAGDNTFGGSVTWVSLAHAASELARRRALVDDASQDLSRNLDIGKGTFGLPKSDRISDILSAWHLLPEAAKRGRVDFVGAGTDKPVDDIIAAMGVADRCGVFHSSPQGFKNKISALPVQFCDPLQGPNPRGDILIDLGLGQSMPEAVMANKITWVSKYKTAIMMVLPDSGFRAKQTDKITLPYGLRLAYETYNNVKLLSTLRWHQADFMMLLYNRLDKPKNFTRNVREVGSFDSEFRSGPYASWTVFCSRRAALCQIGNIWVSYCDEQGIRRAPSFQPTCMGDCIGSLDQYKSITGVVDLRTRFGKPLTVTDLNAASVDDDVFLNAAKEMGGLSLGPTTSGMEVPGAAEHSEDDEDESPAASGGRRSKGKEPIRARRDDDEAELPQAGDYEAAESQDEAPPEEEEEEDEPEIPLIPQRGTRRPRREPVKAPAKGKPAETPRVIRATKRARSERGPAKKRGQ